MSYHKRGIVDGVVHYCDQGWWTRKAEVAKQTGTTIIKAGRTQMLFPWCMGPSRDIQPAEPTTKKAMVTCFQCLWLRKKRP